MVAQMWLLGSIRGHLRIKITAFEILPYRLVHVLTPDIVLLIRVLFAAHHSTVF